MVTTFRRVDASEIGTPMTQICLPKANFTTRPGHVYFYCIAIEQARAQKIYY